MTELTVTVATEPSHTVVGVHGKILMDTREPLDEVVDRALSGPAPRLVFDLSDTTVCDSSGLQLFLDAQRRATAAGGWLRLAAPGPLVRKVLEVTNLTGVLSVHGSVREAVSAS